MVVDKETLEVRLKWRETGLWSEWYRIYEDPKDTPQLLRHLESLARQWRNLDASTRWLDQYELHVRSVDRPSRHTFIVSGIGK